MASEEHVDLGSLPDEQLAAVEPPPGPDPRTTYTHTRLYVVRIVDTRRDGETKTWFVGPLGSTGADHEADWLENTANDRIDRDEGNLRSRECYVEPLYEGVDTLPVGG